MSEAKRLFLGMTAWLVAVTGLHAYLNVDWSSFLNEYLPADRRKLNVAYIPVT
jgi:NitT/TauT family transport system substrate-binding protein